MLSLPNLNSVGGIKYGARFLVSLQSRSKSKKLPNIAAIFTYGRETTIPEMFSKILNKIDKKDKKYTNLRLYINRHIEVDSSRHGPLSLELFNFTCNNDQKIFDEAISFAIKAIDSRINLWDGVYKKIRDLD